MEGLLDVGYVSIGSLVDKLTELYKNNIQQPPVMLWGPPGIGKSDGVRQVANNLHTETGRPVYVFDIRLLLLNPVDLNGLPVPDENKEYAKWLRPSILPPKKPMNRIEEEREKQRLHEAIENEASEEVLKHIYDPNAIYILFLDEITAAPTSLQAAAYQLTLDRRVGDHILPDNTIIIAAGNRASDKGSFFKMPAPLSNRMIHFEVYTDYEEWKEWALNNNIHPYIISYMNKCNGSDLFKFDSKVNPTAFPSPRSWANLSKILHNVDDFDTISMFASATIGGATANAFMAFIKNFKDMPSVEDILNGKDVPYPQDVDIYYALSGALDVDIHKGISMNQFINLIAWLKNIPHPELAVSMYYRYPKIKYIREYINSIEGKEARETILEMLGKYDYLTT